jgi:ABC-type transport system substrate-binding protein
MEEARQVRWALAEAFDREAINEAIMAGLGWPVYVEYAQVHSPDLWEARWEIPYDLADAKARLADTAWPDGFEIAMWVQMPHAVRPEVADAVAGYWLKLGSQMTVEVIKSAYTIVRPSLVGRTLSLPIVMECDEGRTSWPPDWPKGMVATSLTRGGFGCGNESPYIAQAYLKTRAELDRDTRLATNKGVVDHMWYWQVGTGIVAQPVVFTYNPKSIKQWTSDVEFWGTDSPMFGIYNTVPADR